MSVTLNLSPCWRFAYSPRFQFSPLCFCLVMFVWSLPACHNVCDCLLASLLHPRLCLSALLVLAPFEGWGPQYKMNHFKCDFFFLSAFFKKISSVIKIILVWFVLPVFLALRTLRWVNF